MPFAEARVVNAVDRHDFVVPPELEAHEPPENRGASREDVRLLVTDSVAGARHSQFSRLPEYLAPGDLLVLNDSKTYPAALEATRETGEIVQLNFASLGPDEWASDRASDARPTTERVEGWASDARPTTERVEDRASDARPRSDWAWRGIVLAKARNASLAAGERVALPGGGHATFFALHRRSRRMWITGVELPLPYFAYFARYGKPIAYSHVTRDLPIEAFQTTYAAALGSSEMPSAGRPITRTMLDSLASRGVEVTTITLHAGVSSDERDEPPLEEWRNVSAEAAAAARRARARGRRVVAAGTTVVRALESSLDRRQRVAAACGWTSLHITSDRPMRAVSGLLTGFHEPTSTHLAILDSIAGRAHIGAAYSAALAERYLWHEFGDAHLILP
jgi:S-adenosylmethionine:tRNA ribosyltransferase-isomerase